MNLFAWDAADDEPINPAKPQRELRALARTLDRVEADLVALQEVGSQRALEDLNSLLKRPFEHLALAPSNSIRGIHVGFLARSPFELDCRLHPILTDGDGSPLSELATANSAELTPLRIQRSIAIARLKPANAPTLHCLGVHLKSPGRRPWHTLSPLTIRLAECRLLAEVIDDLKQTHPDSPLVILGDFNDAPTSAAFAPLEELTSGVLFDPLLRELVPANPRLTTYWPKRRTRVDRILLDQEAAAHYQRGSMRIWTGNTAEVASDHFPVSLDLDLHLDVDVVDDLELQLN